VGVIRIRVMLSHIVWTTYLTFPPQDKRGSWESMSKVYEELKRVSEISFVKPLLKEYNSIPSEERGILSFEDQRVVRDSIVDLAKDKGDRVAGGSGLRAIGTSETEVHLLINGTLAESKQKISRLKSRSATLLGFSQEKFGESSKNTWAKGIWAAEFGNEKIAEKVKEFINAKNV